MIGSGLLLVWIAAAGILTEGLPDFLFVLKLIPGVGLAAITTIIIATVFCAFYISLVGLPLAALLGHRLDSLFGLSVAVLASVLAAIAVTGAFGVWPMFGTPDWQFAVLVAGYALPAGLLYRRAVIGARQINPFAEIPA